MLKIIVQVELLSIKPIRDLGFIFMPSLSRVLTLIIIHAMHLNYLDSLGELQVNLSLKLPLNLFIEHLLGLFLYMVQ